MQFLNAARLENIERRATVPDFLRASAGTIRGTAADTRGNYQYTRPGAYGGPNTSLDEPAADQSSMRRFLGWNPPGHVLRSVTRSLWSLSATLAIIGRGGLRKDLPSADDRKCCGQRPQGPGYRQNNVSAQPFPIAASFDFGDRRRSGDIQLCHCCGPEGLGCRSGVWVE
jgi:hypothetical protein